MEAVDSVLKSGSVVDQLLYGTDLPRFEHSDETAVLGLRQVDFLVVNILMAAGITVELVGRSPAVEGMEEHCPLYHAVQIVDNMEVDLQMQKRELTQVKWLDKRDMLGLQVKLNGAHKWKVTIDSEARDQHVAGMEDATYNGIGSAHLFNSKLFHRSGLAPRRCVKLALFFQKPSAGSFESLSPGGVKLETKDGVNAQASTSGPPEADSTGPPVR